MIIKKTKELVNIGDRSSNDDLISNLNAPTSK